MTYEDQGILYLAKKDEEKDTTGYQVAVKRVMRQ